MSGRPSLPPGHGTRLSKEETEWMIQDMGWIPADFPSQGITALMRAKFSEAIAVFGLQAKVLEAETQRHPVPTGPSEAEDTIEEIEIKSQSSTEVVTSDAEIGEPTQQEAGKQDDSFDPLAADLVSPDRCEEEDALGGPSSADPKDQPDSKRRRPLSCLRWRSSPVLRQATALPQNGIFGDFAGLVLARSSSVIAPSKEMVTMAMFRAIQCTPMPDIGQLTVCSRKWAAERPRCLSLAVR